MAKDDLVVFSGNANLALAHKICGSLGQPLGSAYVSRFADAETRIEIESNVRGRDVFIIQPTCTPANEHFMELLIMLDAVKRASAQRITAVIPYYGYARQERKTAPRTPITAKLVADLLQVAGANRILTMELHTGAVQGFFNIPVDHLLSKRVIFDNLKKFTPENPIIVSPDTGGVEKARSLAQLFGCGLAIVDKRRDRPGVSEVMHIIGDVKDKSAILIDDICDSAGTLTNAARALLDKGAKQVLAAVTHPVLSGQAVERISKSDISAILVTDTIPLKPDALACPKIKVVSVAELLANAIRRIHDAESISSLFL